MLLLDFPTAHVLCMISLAWRDSWFHPFQSLWCVKLHSIFFEKDDATLGNPGIETDVMYIPMNQTTERLHHICESLLNRM